MGATAAAFAGTRAAGHFTDAAGLAQGIAAYAGRVAGVIFAVALLDAAVIGAFAVSLSTAYAMGDTLGLKHSLHRGIKQAKGFYAIYAALIAGAAAIVLIPGAPLGLMIEGVQVLAGVLLPSATVFLLLLCNDHAVLGPWVNRRGTNVFTSAVVAVLVTLSVVLTASVLFPALTGRQIEGIILGCAIVGIAAGALIAARSWRRHSTVEIDRSGRDSWRMPPLNMLTKPVLSAGRKAGLAALRGYLAIAMILVIVKIVQVATAH
jgi:Natural resistance-associated macrophage protein